MQGISGTCRDSGNFGQRSTWSWAGQIKDTAKKKAAPFAHDGAQNYRTRRLLKPARQVEDLVRQLGVDSEKIVMVQRVDAHTANAEHLYALIEEAWMPIQDARAGYAANLFRLLSESIFLLQHASVLSTS